ncbi:hypothetical protein [Enterobacter sp. CC120223-11]|uniref:hypothetical protein n=1 Tax=Enterobacter sp. CC120223-11 TaxID=1378073 RepID=UPI000BDB50DF|nr:hypothetical protein [Enterobacter sp. CC120223-11]SNY65335.1 hypothetical protein SAMN02744775_01310 [Enterobacter sp. CC120223-11]
MLKRAGITALSVLMLSGCAETHSINSVVTPTAPQKVTNEATDNSATRVPVCRKELEVIKTYSKTEYDAFLAEYTRVELQTSQYVRARENISPDINELALPRYQFQARELCFRIKTRLTQLIIEQK